MNLWFQVKSEKPFDGEIVFESYLRIFGLKIQWPNFGQFFGAKVQMFPTADDIKHIPYFWRLGREIQMTNFGFQVQEVPLGRV